MQKPYYRDIWTLGPSSNRYPGAFPRGLIPKIKRKWWGSKRLWLFSGSYRDNRDGVTFDIKKELCPCVCGNCEVLPFKNNSFDFIMADPPYSEKESKELYQLPYVNIIKTLNEMIRICKPGGHILFLHRLVPSVFPGLNLSKKTQMVGVVGVFTIAGMSNIRALTIFKKRGELVHEYFV
jgi:SAM-dependent methyltransferase